MGVIVTAVGVLVAAAAIVVPLIVGGGSGGGSSNTSISNNKAPVSVGTINYGTIENQTVTWSVSTVAGAEATGPTTCEPIADFERSLGGVKAGAFVSVSADPDSCWVPSMTAASTPETLDFMLAYSNDSNAAQTGVVMTVQLPDLEKAQSGSFQLTNGNYPNSYTYSLTRVDNRSAWAIGNYNPGIDAFLTYKAVTPHVQELKCGKNVEPVNIWVQPKGQPSLKSHADVTFFRAC